MSMIVTFFQRLQDICRNKRQTRSHTVQRQQGRGCLCSNQSWHHWSPPSINRNRLWNSLCKTGHCVLHSTILWSTWWRLCLQWRGGEVAIKDLQQNQEPYLDRWRLLRIQLEKTARSVDGASQNSPGGSLTSWLTMAWPTLLQNPCKICQYIQKNVKDSLIQ